MIRTRWRKVLLDLWGNKARTVLVVLAIAVGVFAVGFMRSIQSILVRELDSDFKAANVAAATIFTQPFDDAFAERIAAMPEIAAAEGRRRIRVRVNIGPDQWRSMILIARPDFDQIQIDRLTPISGAVKPGRQGIIVERLVPSFLNTAVGETLTLELEDGTTKHLTVSGTAHDAQVIGPEITNTAFGYITMDTLGDLGLGEFYTELRFTVAENEDDLAHIQAVTAAVEEQLEESGREVYGRNIPVPGEREIEQIVDTLILILTVFGYVILCLAGFLVVNTIAALITQQIQQIGVMKLVGARRGQIILMYVVMVLLYGAISLAIGMPLALLFAQWIMSNIVVDLMNIMPESYAVPLSVLLQQAAVGLIIPLVAALWPVLGGVQVTTQQALSSLGLGSGVYGAGLMDRLFGQAQRFLAVERPLIIAVRNTVRRKGRLALTLAILIMGTALFISVLSVRASVSLTLDNFMRYHQYDVALDFNRPYRAQRLLGPVDQMAGVQAAEVWTLGTALRQRPDGSQSDGWTVYAIPPVTVMMRPQVEAGRWLQPGDTNAVVINSDVLDDEPDLALGQSLKLEIDGRTTEWQIVGIAPTESKGATIYVPYGHYAYLTRTIGRANRLQVVTAQHEAKFQAEMETALLQRYEAAGFSIGRSRTTRDLQVANTLGFNIVITFLILMAVLLAIVGGLGLTTTMSINVLERIREIGVLRAIGASNGAVRRIVVAEGLVIGFLSWVVGVLLSLPLSRLLSDQVGRALLGIPLNFTYSIVGATLWFVAVLLIAAVASLGPAQNASRLTIREVLAYE